VSRDRPTQLVDGTARSKALFDAHEVCNPDQDRRPEYPFLVAPVERCAHKGGTLYDVGCGRGYWFDLYEELGMQKSRLVGVDLSDTAVSRLAARGYRAIQADAADMRHIDAQVADLVVAVGSLMHTQDTLRALDQCRRLLKPDGELLVNLYNVYHPYFWVIHKLTWPLRTWCARWVRFWWHPFLLFFQLQNWLRRRRFLNRTDLEAVFFDQVMVPFAHLHSRREIVSWMEANGLRVLDSGYNLGGSMFWVEARLPAA
jgi:SAM-dependent methyltransferase